MYSRKVDLVDLEKGSRHSQYDLQNNLKLKPNSNSHLLLHHLEASIKLGPKMLLNAHLFL